VAARRTLSQFEADKYFRRTNEATLSLDSGGQRSESKSTGNENAKALPEKNLNRLLRAEESSSYIFDYDSHFCL
jgi:hypothetical protein